MKFLEDINSSGVMVTLGVTVSCERLQDVPVKCLDDMASSRDG